MAGVKGRSGGARPGAGRPKGSRNRAEEGSSNGQAQVYEDPVDFLMHIVNSPTATEASKVRAAVAAAQYLRTRTRDGGKKEARQEKAEQASAGRFAPAAPPLKLVGKG